MPTFSTTFGERFGFGRWWQSLTRADENDAEFARAVGRSSTQIGEYRKAAETPNANLWPDVAERMGVDYGWLTGRTEGPPDSWEDRALFLDLLERWVLTARRQREAEALEKERAGPRKSVFVTVQPSAVSYGRAEKKKRPPREA